MTSPPQKSEASDAQSLRSLDELRLWHRFHWRLTTLYTLAILLILAGLGWTSYQQGVASEIETLQASLRATAVALSHTIDVEEVRNLTRPEDTATPEFRRLTAQFAEVSSHHPGVSTIYIFRPGATPTELIFVADYSRNGETGEIGETYDASDVPLLLEGLKEVRVEREPVGDRFGMSLSGYAPLRDQQQQVFGVVGIDMDVSRIDAVKSRVLTFVLIAFGVTVALMILISVIASRMLRRPLRAVIEAADDLASGQLERRLALDRADEFGLLGEHFNEMARGLQERARIRETFGRYMSEDVAQALLGTPGAMALGGEEREVTVLFSDLAGYSTLSESLSPTQNVTFINAYLGEMNEIIDAHRGCVIEYLGDAILAVFNAPNDLEEHADAALRCAVDMRARCVQLNVEWRESGLAALWLDQGIAEITARIGVHTGRVVAGNLGSATRMKYGVTGDAVNVAARLEQLNKALGTNILTSADTHARLSPEVAAMAQHQGAHQVKGREQGVEVYAL